MTRIIYERHTDTLFASALRRPDFGAHFLNLVFPGRQNFIQSINTQTRHAVHSGTIDLDLVLDSGLRLLVENKIDAAYSVTREGAPQPERYAASVAALQARGVHACSVLLAPRMYLAASRFASAFDHAISYEALRPGFSGAELALLDAAIVQAEAPYEPEPNDATADFFASYTTHASKHFPDLVIKHNPNGNGVRPSGSNTIYFVVPRMLRDWVDVPRPRMSLQCRDSSAPSASVKIMIGGLGPYCRNISTPPGLTAIGGYLRAAGQSLGCVIDTPRLDTQRPLQAQLSAVDDGLAAADRLRRWWNGSGCDVTAIIKKTAA